MEWLFSVEIERVEVELKIEGLAAHRLKALIAFYSEGFFCVLLGGTNDLGRFVSTGPLNREVFGPLLHCKAPLEANRVKVVHHIFFDLVEAILRFYLK